MRVLVVASPLPGHVLPLVTLAVELQAAGHQVVLATTGDALAACPPGLTTADVAPNLRLLPLFLKFSARHPRLTREEATGRAGTRAAPLMWAPVNERMAPGVHAQADALQPDLVLCEPLAPVAAEVAGSCGAPLVLVESILVDARELFDAGMRAYLGGADVPGPAEVLTTVPSSLVGRSHGSAMRYVAPGSDRPFDESFTGPGDRPRVLVSRSTVDDPRRDRLMGTVVDAAAGTDLDVVLVRPDRWVAQRDLPPNVRTTDWLPFPAVLPAAAGIVHHGGAGTLLTALAAGVPQLVVRGAGDRRTNADLLAARGAGLGADLGDLSPALLQRLVGDAALTSAASEVAAEMAAMPHPRELVPALELLAARVPE